MTKISRSKAFTMVELLVVISVITLLMGILLPALGKARDQAKMTVSKANLRNLATAHNSYAAEWNDRQFTLAHDSLADYGPNAVQALQNFKTVVGVNHPPLILGWAQDLHYGGYGLWRYFVHEPGRESLVQPIVFEGDKAGFGYFRIPNVKQFNQYVSGRFYDKIFFAPKDTIVWDFVSPAFEDPAEYTPSGASGGDMLSRPVWSSYCLSPAALFSPDVMRDTSRGGWQSPWREEAEDGLAGAFRAPGMSQAAFPNLKTHMLEHHWLQGQPTECNANIKDVATGYDGCEPYYFNHGYESKPVALFYDAHIETVSVMNAIAADARMLNQTEEDDHGLWSRDTPLGGCDDGPVGGYFMDYSYDEMAFTSFHILTTNGIRGRDFIAD